ncbi:MAG TPA: hypothetical protein PKD26_11650 [Pyrinomonadaceae bacterium]|nr:hypothetical protein [Pyrinomonadaceae bacterium]
MCRSFLSKGGGFNLVMLVVVALVLAAGEAFAQEVPSQAPSANREFRDPARTMQDYIARQRSEKARKDHEELLKRGDEAVSIAEELEVAMAENNQLSAKEMEKLASLERLVSRIRKGLGGDGDGDGLVEESLEENDNTPTIEAAVSNLKELTVRLVCEMRKTSRFTVSVVAIQSSNSVLSLVKFLRIRK